MTGFAQQKYQVSCGSCHFSVTRGSIGVAKFTRDAILDPEKASGKTGHLP